MKNKFKPSTYIFLLYKWLFCKKIIKLGAQNFGINGYILNRKYYTFKNFLWAAKMRLVYQLEAANFDNLTIKQIYNYKL